MHDKPHPRIGEVVPLLVNGHLCEFEVEDWAERVDQRYATLGEDMVYGHLTEEHQRTAKIIPNDTLAVRHAT